jgi:signal transduction histidine kinase
MSHELRTPLNAVLGFAQLMASEPPPPTPHAAALDRPDPQGRLVPAAPDQRDPRPGDDRIGQGDDVAGIDVAVDVLPTARA